MSRPIPIKVRRCRRGRCAIDVTHVPGTLLVLGRDGCPSDKPGSNRNHQPPLDGNSRNNSAQDGREEKCPSATESICAAPRANMRDAGVAIWKVPAPRFGMNNTLALALAVGCTD